MALRVLLLLADVGAMEGACDLAEPPESDEVVDASELDDAEEAGIFGA